MTDEPTAPPVNITLDATSPSTESTQAKITQEQQPVPTSQPTTQPPPAPPAQDRMAKAREAARTKALAHDINTCLCPFCKGRRKAAGIQQPPQSPRLKPADKSSTPSNTAKSGDVAVVHDRDKCPCTDCSQWRTERARSAAIARHARAAGERYDWENTPLSEAERHLGELRREVEEGARALKQRYSTASQQYVECAQCHTNIPNGRWAQSRQQVDRETGLPKAIFLCSQACINNYSYKPSNHGPDSGEPTGLHPEQRRAQPQ